MSGRPNCIVCGRPIRKRMETLWFSPATSNGRQNGDRGDTSVYLDEELHPRTKEEAARYTNHEITRVTFHNGRVSSITWWTGEYDDPFFDTGACAKKQGYASAQHGHRYTWR